MKIIRTISITDEIVNECGDDTGLGNEINKLLEDLQNTYKDTFRLIDIKYAMIPNLPKYANISAEEKYDADFGLCKHIEFDYTTSIQGCLIIYECDTKYDNNEEVK